MNIGELSRRSGLTNSRIRFYERAGLLKTVDRQANGYRTYSPDAVVVLQLIATAQKAGFSLDEIRALLPPDLKNWQHDALIGALRTKVKDIEALQKRLQHSKAQLVSLIRDIEGKPSDMDCSDNARRVLSRILGADVKKPDMTSGDVRLLDNSDRRQSVAPERVKRSAVASSSKKR